MLKIIIPSPLNQNFKLRLATVPFSDLTNKFKGVFRRDFARMKHHRQFCATSLVESSFASSNLYLPFPLAIVELLYGDSDRKIGSQLTPPRPKGRMRK